MVFGRSSEADVQLFDVTVSRQHAVIDRSESGFEVRDLGGRTGSLVNGRYFDRHALVFGDRLQIGPFLFRFEGTNLQRIEGGSGGTVEAVQVTRYFGTKRTLADINLSIAPGQFVGILGTSGAGKSTLLDALSGMRLPSSGSVRIDGADLYHTKWSSAPCGYVPQDDIVHLELTVEAALRFSAALRLPSNMGKSQLDRLVTQTIDQLGLSERTSLCVGKLSGGQRKRVSIGAELLSRPRVLFLDEPSSGLDPSTEFKLMELLRELANTGCTIVCTTHVMENVYLMDEVVVVSAGRLVFKGPPSQVLTHFQIPRFAALYDRVLERPAEEWQQLFDTKKEQSAKPEGGPPSSEAVTSSRRYPSKSFSVLLRRQLALLLAERKNIAMLLGQPILIGLMVAWMADTVGLKLFLAYLGTFWFGCSNAAQEIVKEVAIYRRERLVGLPRRSYLAMKFLFLSGATSLQALIFYGAIHFGERGMEGSLFWQLSCLLLTAWCSVGIGLAISALVRTTTQAVMLVPLILLPQIVFSGFVLPSLAEGGGAKKVVSEIMPSYSSQKLMDVSILWDQELTQSFLRDHQFSSHNIDPRGTLAVGQKYLDTDIGFLSLARLTGWCVVTVAIAWFGLRSRERSV
jgi:ABC transport system ATP-binding/permease protein